MLTEQQKRYLQAMEIPLWELRASQQSSVEPKIAWEPLEKAVSGCTLCPLHCARKQTVFGTGNRQAEIMFVGEAPGAEEDKQGKPFVGRAGQLLTRMLSSVDIERETVFIANILKCRPPGNRDPLPEEVHTCTPYLEQQIQLIKPKLLVALGRYAAQYLTKTGNTPLSRLRGKTHVYEALQVPLIVTYHPAYLLRNPKDKKKSFEDLQFIVSHIG